METPILFETFHNAPIIIHIPIAASNTPLIIEINLKYFFTLENKVNVFPIAILSKKNGSPNPKNMNSTAIPLLPYCLWLQPA